ncbi:hypothetical protein [Flavobacterium sp. HTF]|uniref:hypothetical protein n=1 Tax=Flavobacterium sp. HTF TaxID=2170732 RepID=UPI000D5DD1D1|nr:hypothetical protein [Flavobacterium sp. HTF]PWB25896.1 hypothetical protein DCO46_07565 [Flavobacterium sp. HTF]
MKKKLEADLISIAHRILKLKNKSDINQLYLETQKLYEKLAVLKFVDENFDNLKPTIGRTEVESQIETIFENETTAPQTVKAEEEIAIPVAETVTEEIPQPETEETKEEVVSEIPEEIIPEPVSQSTEEPVIVSEEPIIEEKEEIQAAEELSFRTTNDLKPIPDFKPAFELEREETKEEPKIETPAKSDAVHISFEDILGVNYANAQFVKVDDFENVTPKSSPINDFKENKAPVDTILESAKPKTVPLNEKLAKGFHIDLNDRIAFTKNLFGNSTEDYSRVLNQLLTFGSYSEAVDFIENMVKPDYNNWEGKDDYAERFLGIIEKKFA